MKALELRTIVDGCVLQRGGEKRFSLVSSNDRGTISGFFEKESYLGDGTTSLHPLAKVRTDIVRLINWLFLWPSPVYKTRGSGCGAR